MTSDDDHLTLLLALGADMVGDVEVMPAGSPRRAVAPTVDEEDIPSLDLLEVLARASGPEGLERVALPGAQAKVSAAMISAPVRTASGAAILKLNPDRGCPQLLRNEHFFLGMAAGLGLPVPAHRLVADRLGREGLLVERFDRTGAADGYRRLEQEDGCQLVGAYPAAKYRLKTEDVVRAAADWVEQGDGSRPRALRRLVELVAFSYLIGNGDLHGKNISVRRRPDGIREVTPVYDVLTTQPYAGWRDPMALDLYGRAIRLDRGHLQDAARRLGLAGRATTAMLDHLTAAAQPWIDRAGEIGFGERQTVLLQELMTRRLSELRG